MRSIRLRKARINTRRSLTSSRGNTHAFTRWASPSQYNAVTGQGSINFDSTMTYSGGTLVTNAATAGIKETPFSIQFTLNDVPNNTEISALYDQYKLCGAKVSIKMINSPESTYVNNGSANSYTNFYPTLWYTRDYDDNDLLSLTAMRQYKSARHVVLRPNKEISIYTKPRMLRQLFNSNTGAGYEIALPKYVDLGNIALPHYGLKAVIDYEGQDIPLSSATNQWRFRVNVKYYFMCKNVR